MSVSEKTECAGHFDRIVQSLRRDIRLTDQCHTRHRSAFKLSLHRRERDRLVIADYLRLLVAGGKGNEKRCDQTNERSRAQIKSRLNRIKAAQSIEGADRSHDKRAGDERG